MNRTVAMMEKRPWGGFKVIHSEEGTKVKILEVQPGMRLSYQSHEHRMERWVIIQGEADVTIDGKETWHSRGDMVQIDRGQKHRIANPGTAMLRIVEVQIGDYLEEDDITRYEDDFGRV
ncbi:MAG: phosphomannose isomerase type II C-terminal cupin domain [Thermoplasmatota archaeon]